MRETVFERGIGDPLGALLLGLAKSTCLQCLQVT